MTSRRLDSLLSEDVQVRLLLLLLVLPLSESRNCFMLPLHCACSLMLNAMMWLVGFAGCRGVGAWPTTRVVIECMLLLMLLAVLLLVL